MLKNKSSLEVKVESKEAGDRFEITIDISAVSSNKGKPATLSLFYPNLKLEAKKMIMDLMVTSLSNINDEAPEIIAEKGKKTSIDFIVTDLDYIELLDAQKEIVNFIYELIKVGRNVNTGYNA